MLHGSYSYVMQDEDGQTCDVHSISAGLDYPGVGPEHSYWKDTGRVHYTCCEDDDALPAFDALAPKRRHSAGPGKLARDRQGDGAGAGAIDQDEVIVVCLSGRGDKDAAEIARLQAEQQSD